MNNKAMVKTAEIIGNRTCYIYDSGSKDNLLIQAVDDHDIEVLDSEVDKISELAEDVGFTLAAFKVEDWNTDLSPWEAPPVFGNDAFGGKAEETLRYVEEVLIPELMQAKDTRLIIGGYSLSAFFALWAAYQTDLFAGVAAASPSVWFPGWMDYVKGKSAKSPYVYLSLGDKEEKTKNAVMRTVGDNIRRQLEILKAEDGCADCILEMNQGNHFKEPDIRTAKGFAWILRSLCIY